MHISASIRNTGQQNEVIVTTNEVEKPLALPAKANSKGSAVNGGELLFLALATCFCNDIYREAAKRQIEVRSVEVNVAGEFGSEGEPGFDIRYEATVDADASDEEVQELIAYVDQIAEVHNTVRKGTAITLIKNDKPSQ